MSLVSSLRESLSADSKGKDMSRAAGAGIWAYYCNAMHVSGALSGFNDGAVDQAHKALLSELESLAPLEKNEKNSLSSAKSVLKKAHEAGKEIFRKGEDGVYISEDGLLVPRGKNELQDDRPWFDALQKKLAGLQKQASAEDAEPLSEEQRTAVAVAIASVLSALGMADATPSGADDAPF